MHQTMLILAVAGIALAPALASAATANAYDVEPRGQDVFDVRANVGPSTSIRWCGAGQYAGNVSGASNAQPVYVVQGRSRQSGASVVRFSLTPPSSGALPVMSTSVEAVGNSLSVSQARQYYLDKTMPDT